MRYTPSAGQSVVTHILSHFKHIHKHCFQLQCVKHPCVKDALFTYSNMHFKPHRGLKGVLSYFMREGLQNRQDKHFAIPQSVSAI